MGEGLYIMVDSEDYIHYYSVSDNEIIPIKLIGKRETLYEHILAKFICIKAIYDFPKEGYRDSEGYLVLPSEENYEEDDEWMEY